MSALQLNYLTGLWQIDGFDRKQKQKINFQKCLSENTQNWELFCQPKSG